MAMTIGEAHEVQDVLRWVLSLRLFEHDPHAADAPPPADAFADALAMLAERSRKVLGAGIGRTEAEDRLDILLGDERPVETVAVRDGLL